MINCVLYRNQRFFSSSKILIMETILIELKTQLYQSRGNNREFLIEEILLLKSIEIKFTTHSLGYH